MSHHIVTMTAGIFFPVFTQGCQTFFYKCIIRRMLRLHDEGTNQIIHSISAGSLDNVRKPDFPGSKCPFLKKCLTKCFCNIADFILRHHSPVKRKRFTGLCDHQLFCMFKASIAPFPFFILYKQSLIVIFFYLFCKLTELYFIFFFPKDFCKLCKCYCIRIKKRCFHIFPGKLVVRISPVPPVHNSENLLHSASS